MFARLTTIQGKVDKIADGIRLVENDVIPATKVQPGFKNGYWCVDRKTGRMLALTLYGSEKELDASEAAAATVRKTATEKLGFEVMSVERFEVIAQA